VKRKKPLYPDEPIPFYVDQMADIVCQSCHCVSGYGRPPEVAECPCQCHDTARLWWRVMPWQA
jgi:hypothetical protein